MKLDDDIFTALAMRDGTVCYICGIEDPLDDDDPIQIEHHYPKALGGQDNMENLRLAHRSCNNRKNVGAVCPKRAKESV